MIIYSLLLKSLGSKHLEAELIYFFIQFFALVMKREFPNLDEGYYENTWQTKVIQWICLLEIMGFWMSVFLDQSAHSGLLAHTFMIAEIIMMLCFFPLFHLFIRHLVGVVFDR